jgi:hypothetical protein
MAKFTMTTGAQRHDLVYQLDFMGRSYPLHFRPTADGMISVEDSIFSRVPDYYNLPKKIRAAIHKCELPSSLCDINEAVQTLTQYERERMSHTDAPRHHIRR